jgi:DNA-binding MarR family transcriptional regulator
VRGITPLEGKRIMKFSQVPTDRPDVHRLAGALRDLELAHRALLTRVVRELCLSRVEYGALVAAVESGGITPKMLASSIGLTTSATTAALDRLEAAGLLRREPHLTDRRSLMVRATAEGEQAVTDVYADYLAAVAEVADGLESDQVESLATVLQKVTTAVRSTRCGSEVEAGSAETLRLVG